MRSASRKVCRAGRKRGHPWVVVEGGYTQFGTRVPFPPKLGAHVIKVRANRPGREAKPEPRAISCGSPLQKFHQTGSSGSKSANRNDFRVVAQRLEMRGPHAPQVRESHITDLN